MSVTDPSAEPVQPDEESGQGGEQATSGEAPYASYLDRIPEEVRGDVEPVFKDWDANVTKRFQEASQYKQAWEPYEQLGVNQRDPQEVEWALQFLEAAKSNPQGVAQWYNESYAPQHGLSPQEAAAQQQQEAGNQEFVDPEVAALRQQMQQMQQQYLGPMGQQLQGLSQWQQQQEQQYRQQAAMSEVQKAWDEVKSKAGTDWNDERVEQFLGNHLDKEPRAAIEAAHNDWVSLKNQIEKQALQAKADVPAGAEAGGAPDGTPPKVDSLARATEIAMEQLRANNRA